MATTTIVFHTTHSCGHVTELTQWSPSGTGAVTERTVAFACAACRENPPADTPFWQRAGYVSEAGYHDAVAHHARVREVERQRAEDAAAINALPEAQRPYTTRAPMSGFGPIPTDD